MQFEEAKNKFVQTWGILASHWGINRTMAQIHALLMASHEPLSAEDIMEQLNVSRGNANMNIRALIDWGLVYREIIPGERREFFIGEKDVYKVAKQIVKIRREREINPVLQVLSTLQHVEGNSDGTKQFVKLMKDINELTGKASAIADKMIAADETWLGKAILKLMK